MGKVTLHMLGPVAALAGYVYYLRVKSADMSSIIYHLSLWFLALSNFLGVILLAILIKKFWSNEVMSYRTVVGFSIGLVIGDYFFFLTTG